VRTREDAAIRSDVWPASVRLVRAGAVVAAVAALCLVASPPAFAQLSFSSTDFPIAGIAPQAVVASDFNGDGHLDLATANNGFATPTPTRSPTWPRRTPTPCTETTE